MFLRWSAAFFVELKSLRRPRRLAISPPTRHRVQSRHVAGRRRVPWTQFWVWMPAAAARLRRSSRAGMVWLLSSRLFELWKLFHRHPSLAGSSCRCKFACALAPRSPRRSGVLPRGLQRTARRTESIAHAVGDAPI